MKIDVCLSPHEVSEEKLKDHIAVVVDVLRASTTICAALAAGAKEIIPAESIEEAIRWATNLSRDAILLCGEREGKLIEGFNLANSPLEYKPKIVKGKTLIFGSTNGSPTVVKTRLAQKTYLAGFVNMTAIVQTLAEVETPIVIICSGKLGQFSLEDAVCAGNIVSALKQSLESILDLTDGANAALLLYQHYQESILKMVKESDHGRYLASIGMQHDLPICADLNRIPVVPVFHDGKIRIQKDKPGR
jgi:2-phosphosulfolactate phosphatase